MLAMLGYLVLLGGLGVLVAASVGALKEAIRQRARLRGIALTVGLMVLSLLGLWAVLI
jgi:hypothetical protein